MSEKTSKTVNDARVLHAKAVAAYAELNSRIAQSSTDIDMLNRQRDDSIAANDSEIEARAQAMADCVERATKPLCEVAEIETKIAGEKALLGKLQPMLPQRRALRDGAKKELDRANEAHARAVTTSYFEPGSFLLDWSKVADLPLREAIAILCAKGPPDGDPRIALRIPVGKIGEAEWLKIKDRVAEILATGSEASA